MFQLFSRIVYLNLTVLIQIKKTFYDLNPELEEKVKQINLELLWLSDNLILVPKIK